MSAGLSQQFCVRWNSHLGSLGAAFPQLLAGQRFVDVTLACEGHQVHCHRLVLAACSTYFENLLGENPCKHPIIILPRDIKLWEIQALVDFMYKGEVNVSQAGLPDLLKCAEILKIRGLCGSDAALNLNQITSSAASSAIVTGATPQNQTQPTSNVTETNTSMHNSGQNNNHSNNHTNNLTNPALAQSILSSRLNQLDTKPLSSSSMMKNNSLLNSLNLQPIAPSIRPQSLTGNFSSHGIGSVNTAAVKHVQPLTLLDDADNSDNGSGSEMCIKTEDLIIDEDVGKMKDEEEEDDVEMEANDKLQSDQQVCEIDEEQLQQNENDIENQSDNILLQQHSASPSSSSLLSILSRGSIRVKSNENLFENYKQTEHDQDQNHSFSSFSASASTTSTPCKAAYIYDETPLQVENKNLPTSLVFNKNTMDIYVKPKTESMDSSAEITIEERNNFENIVCSPNFVQLSSNYGNEDDYEDEFSDIQIMTDENGAEDDVFPPPLIPFGNDTTITRVAVPSNDCEKPNQFNRIMNNKMIFNKDSIEQMMTNGGQPPVAFVLRNPRGNQPRTYDTDALWAALMDVKAGESIYRASQIHKVPRKTLRNWMKRWDIKSAYPMPRQLKDAAEKKRKVKEMNSQEFSNLNQTTT